MKRIIKLLLILICFSFSLTISVSAATGTVPVTNDDGSTSTIRGSSQVIMKADEYSYPSGQMRAVWASNFIGSIDSYTTEEKWKEDWDELLDTLEENRINTLIFHVRTHNNANYKSDLNPVSTWFKNVDWDVFDPMEYAITETHKRGIEFHAWMNPYRLKDSFCAEDYPEANPASDEANILVSTKTYNILNPGLPNVRKFLIDTCIEFLSRYDADAIHFDDYFYVSGIDDTSTRAIYNTEDLSVDDFRREQVNTFIKELHEAITKFNKDNNRYVSLGIAPSGIYMNASYQSTPTYDEDGNLTSPMGSPTAGGQHYNGSLYADTVKWINEEWIDYFMPQLYWSLDYSIAGVAGLNQWWSWVVRYKKVNLYCGMGIYMAESSKGGWGDNVNEITDIILNGQMYEEIGGYSYYSYNYLNSDNNIIKTGLTNLKNDYYKTFIPADVKKSLAESCPEETVVNAKLEDNVLSWDSVDGVRGYMVFHTSNKGGTYNKDSSKNIIYYGTSTSLEVSDKSGSYYISTVNMANEISDAVEVDIEEPEITTEYIAELIAALPEYPLKSDEEQVNYIQSLIDNLEDWRQVYNISNYRTFRNIQTYISNRNQRYATITNSIESSGNVYSEANLQAAKDLITKYSELVLNATSEADSSQAATDFTEAFGKIKTLQEEVDDLVSTKFEELRVYVDEKDYTNYTFNQVQSIKRLYEECGIAMSTLTTLESVEPMYQSYLNKINAIQDSKDIYDTNLVNIKSKVKEYVDQYRLNDEYSSFEVELDIYEEELLSAVSEQSFDDIVEHADTIINKLCDKFTNHYNKLVDTLDKQDCNGLSLSTLIIYLVSSVSLLLILKKRH